MPTKEEEEEEEEDSGDSDQSSVSEEEEDEEMMEFSFDLDPRSPEVRREVINGLKDAVRKVALMEVQAHQLNQRLMTQHQQEKLDMFVRGRVAQVKHVIVGETGQIYYINRI